jgi:hypothetical protein
MGHAGGARVTSPGDPQLAALQQTYPGWRITVRSGIWWATKVTPPTEQQRDQGLHHQISRPDAVARAAALAQQHGIVHRTIH